MNTILLNKTKYTYTIERQMRKTLQLRLLPNRAIQLMAPASMPFDDIMAFVQQKTNWICKKSDLLDKTFFPCAEDKPIDHLAQELLFLGKKYSLNISRTLRKPSIHLTNGIMQINLYAPANTNLPSLIKCWYKHQAASILTEKTKYWAAEIGVTFNKITIKEQKTRWGSCSSLGNLNYNWRIIMAPEPTVDYLVIHEVAHRLFLNHSLDFWRIVARYCPNYSKHKLWLKQNSQQLFEII